MLLNTLSYSKDLALDAGPANYSCSVSYPGHNAGHKLTRRGLQEYLNNLTPCCDIKVVAEHPLASAILNNYRQLPLLTFTTLKFSTGKWSYRYLVTYSVRLDQGNGMQSIRYFTYSQSPQLQDPVAYDSRGQFAWRRIVMRLIGCSRAATVSSKHRLETKQRELDIYNAGHSSLCKGSQGITTQHNCKGRRTV